MAFVDGFLALASGITNGAPTEFTLPSYARAPISFGTPVNGRSVATKPVSFGFLGTASASGNSGPIVAGYAVFDSPTGGDLLMLMQAASPIPLPGNGPLQMPDGHFVLTLNALAIYPDGAAYSGTFAAGATLGVSTGGSPIFAAPAPLLAGAGLTVVRGILRAT